ncbi:hypothetical protein [Streptomyces albidus (ex Kaewkla and Franco 2022)]|uniref:hypothetical protein n=1 Tax=Streptomyces albidus (ex Kaewkla and Franco 2022) TaxID=722709 RepID=UPI0015EFCD62|nr:hypothetical protein [Streptomyces albidus (ex Kaewkla and Franco 2022)]
MLLFLPIQDGLTAGRSARRRAARMDTRSALFAAMALRGRPELVTTSGDQLRPGPHQPAAGATPTGQETPVPQ